MELKLRMDALQKEYLRERQELSTKLLQVIRSHEVCTEPVNFYPPGSAGPESADPMLSQFRYPPAQAPAVAPPMASMPAAQQPQIPASENPSSATTITTVQNIPTTLSAPHLQAPPGGGGGGNTSS